MTTPDAKPQLDTRDCSEQDPYESEEYRRIVDELAKDCHCRSPHPRPCDGILAGGLCDGFGCEPDFTLDDLEWSEEHE